MNKATRYRLELISVGADPTARVDAMHKDGWRLLATIPAHGEDESVVSCHLFEKTVDAPIQPFGPVDEIIEWWSHFI